ncbi:MAG: S4 domain-containing protein [Ignavibacteriaceae bacterium]|nr:S4 domain-containing protein [Ignavibacteriaceae bacterium]
MTTYIGISESPKEIFGRTLSIPDSVIYIYYELASDISSSELKGVKHQLEDSKVNPRDIKRRLARTLVRMYHNEEAAIQAEEEFDRIFIKKEVPDEVEEFKIDDNNSEFNILDLILKVNFAPSKGEARGLVTQGGVSIDGNKITDLNFNTKLYDGMILKVGKRKFIKFID